MIDSVCKLHKLTINSPFKKRNLRNFLKYEPVLHKSESVLEIDLESSFLCRHSECSLQSVYCLFYEAVPMVRLDGDGWESGLNCGCGSVSARSARLITH